MLNLFGLSPEVFAYQTAHIKESKRSEILAVLAILVSLSTIAVLMRITIRLRTKVGFGADDYCVIVAWV